LTEGATAELLVDELGMDAATAGVVGAAVGAAAGSIAGQLVGNAIGIQHGFDWKAVAVAALTAGITEGVGSELGLAKDSADAAVMAERAAINTAVGQGVHMLVYQQGSFNWKAVAASAVAAYAGGLVAQGVNSAFGDNVVTGFNVDEDTGDVTATTSNVIS